MVRTRDYADLGKKLKEKFEKKNAFARDPRFWVISRDEAGNGSAVIRFLPNKNIKDYPFVESYKHSFKINGKNFIDRCLKTIDKECPICEWCYENDRDYVKKNQMYKKTNFIHNILVENDPANPENNGKIFIFEFGPQLFDIIKEEYMEEEENKWYFTLDYNKPFKLKVKAGAGGYGNWTASKFLGVTEIDYDHLGMSEKDLMDGLNDLGDFIKQSEYKTYDELKAKFEKFATANGIRDSLAQHTESVNEEKIAKEHDDKKRASILNDDEKEVKPDTPVKTEKKVEKKPEQAETDGVKPAKTKKVDEKMKKVEEVDDYFSKFNVNDD